MQPSKSFIYTLASIVGMLLICQTTVQAQVVADKIIAVIGKNRIILKSELDQQEDQLGRQFNGAVPDSVRCQVLQQLVLQQIMVEQAERDSVQISDEEVEASLDNRIRYFMEGYGGKEQLEAAAGKTIYQIKDDYREFTKDELLSQRMRSQIISGIKVTPVEVRAFFKEVSQDTLPYFPGSVEVGEIIMGPQLNPVLDKYAVEKLEEIRRDIVDSGKNFEAMAGLYSQDPGSRDNGGDLGTISKNSLVPAFSEAAWKLKDGEISQVVKTTYGYHIIQMVQRQGDNAHLRHILIIPEHTSADYTASLQKLDTVQTLLNENKITFAEAVGKYSTDDATKMTGGYLTNPETNSTQLQVDELDPVLALMLDTMKVGNYSTPQIFTNARTGARATRIVYLRSRTEPHQANLKDDYNQIQELALQRKQSQQMQQWIQEKLPTYYIKIDPDYKDCSQLYKWSSTGTF